VSSTQYLTDTATRHQVFLQRFAGGESKKAQKTLDRLRRDINARLALEPTDFQRNRLEIVLKDIEALSVEAFSNISRQTIVGTQELAKSEAAFSARLFDKATTLETNFIIPPDAILVNAVLNTPIRAAGVTTEEILRQFSAKKTKQILQMISDGVTLGETTPAISRNVGNLINTLTRRQLDSLVRTITNSTAAAARNQIYEANSDVLEGYKFIATLDSRTSLECAANDGKIFQIGMGAPMPALHFSCRSTTIPAVLPEYDIGSKLHGKRPAIGSKGVTQVSGRVTYSGWLRKQPTEFIDEVLGTERSRLFRSGKLTIDKFTDNTGRIYTLKQLESLNPMAFLE
jgi:SPP1 gp7 family putative phage head morphogenesis protein